MTADKAIVAAGAGRMGRGIAVTFALAGNNVQLLDLKPRESGAFTGLVQSAANEVRNTLGMLANLGILAATDVDAVAARVTVHPASDSKSVLAQADLVFEGVPETLPDKKSALQLISAQCRPEATIASTTSTMLATELQTFVDVPGRFLNAHWLNPAFLVPLVELSPGAQTDAAITAELKDLLESMGKVPVVCAASPGYIVPRVQALAMNEAARMVEEGVASAEDIDKATLYGFGYRFAVLGLLEFIDWGGGDILYHASRYMVEATGEQRYASPDIIQRNMHEGRTGLRVRQGFLDYSDMDVESYQQQRLGAFVAMLRHLDKMPVVKAGTRQQSASDIVRDYLAAMEARELDCAKSFLAPGFTMTFPGNNQFTTLEALAAWAKHRYQSVGKIFERFDESADGDKTVVYCRGTLHGVWLDGSKFDGIRFIDRFELTDGLLSSQLVWNDMPG